MCQLGSRENKSNTFASEIVHVFKSTGHRYILNSNAVQLYIVIYVYSVSFYVIFLLLFDVTYIPFSLDFYTAYWPLEEDKTFNTFNPTCFKK